MITAQNIDRALPGLCARVLDGPEVGSRNGKTHELIYQTVTLTRPQEREITLSSRRHNLAAQIAETMWVLSGRDDVEWLSRYLPRAADFSDDGVVWRGGYGKRLRRWPNAYPSAVPGESWSPYLDQLAHVVELLKQDPETRRAVLSIYDPEIDMQPGKDIPCNDFLTFNIRDGRLDVGVTIRSNDLMWGWSGINAFEWSSLQEIVAGLVGAEIGKLHFFIASLHLYEQHWKRADAIVAENQRGAYLGDSPRFMAASHDVEWLDGIFRAWFQIEERIRQDHGDPDLRADINSFPEPMLRSWLRVLQWWWSGDQAYLEPLEGTRLHASALAGVQPKRPAPQVSQKFKSPDRVPEFVSYVQALHAEKHAAYGDSWKRRGEMLGIMANIARKIDRLGSNTTTSDESAADTAVDLLVYLAKYRWWLTENGAPQPEFQGTLAPRGGDPMSSNLLIEMVGRVHPPSTSTSTNAQIERFLTATFEQLEEAVTHKDPNRFTFVNMMLPYAFKLAYELWSAPTT